MIATIVPAPRAARAVLCNERMNLFSSRVLVVVAALLPACGGIVETAGAPATSAESEPSAPAHHDEAAPPPPASTPPATGCEAHELTQVLDGDGGVAATIQAQCATVTIDGAACPVDPADVGLDLGLDGHGWTVTINRLSCLGGAILTISGVDDAPYPQTAVEPFLSETSVWLAAGGDELDDAGAGEGVYSTKAPGGSSSITRGPVRSGGTRTISAVAGSAHATGAGGRAHDIQFDIEL